MELPLRLLPMTDDPVSTVVVTPEGELAFQEYFVGRRHDVDVTGVRFEGADRSRPAPGVLEAIEAADAIVVCPSNPVVSIGPVLAVPGVRAAIASRRERVVAVSPIIGGAALKGPADRMLQGLGVEVSAVGVARWYRELAGTLMNDEQDAALAEAVRAEGIRCVVTDTIMARPGVAAEMSRLALAAASSAA